ncbi:MAG: hypothetical protein AAFR55_06385 [Pseudomonadota bacterium]
MRITTPDDVATGTIHGVLRMGRLIPVVHDVMDAGATFLRNRIH